MGKQLLTVFFLSIILASCSKSFYTSTHFERRTENHEIIALLPPKVNLYGNLPQNLSPEDIINIEANESRLYQSMLYSAVLGQKQKKKSIRVEIQSMDYSNRILKTNGIGPHNIEQYSTWEILEMLDVDAVVYTTVNNNRIMSDMTSMGIDIGRGLLEILIRDPEVTSRVPSGMDKTNDLDILVSLKDYSGLTLWEMSHHGEANWKYQDDDIMAFVNRRVSKYFPYR